MCTTEIIAFARANPYFERLNTCLIGLSVDSNPSHLAWLYDIYCKTGIRVPFPIIADRNGTIARKYGRLILVYPMNVGRNIQEILRALTALQVADANKLSMPANWIPCEPGILPVPKTFAELEARKREMEKNQNGMSWYLGFQNVKDCKVLETDNCTCDRIEEKNR